MYLKKCKLQLVTALQFSTFTPINLCYIEHLLSIRSQCFTRFFLKYLIYLRTEMGCATAEYLCIAAAYRTDRILGLFGILLVFR